MQKEKSEFYKERDDAIYNTYLRVLRRQQPPVDINRVIDEMRHEPQPRFWVPARTIYYIIRRYARYHEVSNKPLPRDVISRFNHVRNKRELKGQSLSFIADFVTASATKGFYLSHRRLFDIVRRMRKERFAQRCAAALKGLQGYERQAVLYGPNKL